MIARAEFKIEQKDQPVAEQNGPEQWWATALRKSPHAFGLDGYYQKSKTPKRQINRTLVFENLLIVLLDSRSMAAMNALFAQ